MARKNLGFNPRFFKKIRKKGSINSGVSALKDF